MPEMPPQVAIVQSEQPTKCALLQLIKLTPHLLLLEAKFTDPRPESLDATAVKLLLLARPLRQKTLHPGEVSGFFGFICLSHDLFAASAIVGISGAIWMNQASKRAIESSHLNVIRHWRNGFRDPMLGSFGLLVPPFRPPGGLVCTGFIRLLIELFVRDALTREHHPVEPGFESRDLAYKSFEIVPQRGEPGIEFALKSLLFPLFLLQEFLQGGFGGKASAELEFELNAFKFVRPGGKHYYSDVLT